MAAIAVLLLLPSMSSARETDAQPHGDLALSCDTCHTVEGWSPLLDPLPFQHDLTDFRLIGGHQDVGCAKCHQSLVFSEATTDCFACHQDDAKTADEPDHTNLPSTCQDCHSVMSWRPSTFDHNQTALPLQGAHTLATCEQCHSEGYVGTPTDCFACHESDFNGATDPDHQGFPTSCEDCHTESAWQGATFDHNQTAFPLQGAHTQVACADCHAEGYAGTPTDCFACHESDFNGATDPDHQGFPTTCEDCHTESAWQGATFDHNQTAFPLQGAHTQVACADCHADGYAGTPSDCFACHESDFNGATDPDHQGFPTTCEDCHTESAWQGATFNHAQTGFPLQGAHTQVACADCHAEGYAGTPSDCFACHESDFNGATDPDHQGFPTTCEDCHTESAWQGATFNHAQTGFPLQGAHTQVACADCHADGYAGTPSDCFACHESDFNGATDPDHQGFPTTCEDCHTESAWQGATFNHAQTGFPLQGAHTQVACADCHADGYAGTPSDCFACHESDFNGATEPDHQGFPTTCEDCHTESAWQGATFNHAQTGFPLQGAHTQVACADCHADGYAGTPSDCFACHESDFNGATDPDHQGFPTTCEDCHSETTWQGAAFDHNQTAFPLQGAHTQVACADCHADGYAGTPTDCFACHEDDYDGADDPDHQGFPTTCEDCHQVTAWEPAAFNHNQTAFPLTGSHLAVPCSDCHATGYVGTPIDCFACHEDDYNGANDPDHIAAGFPFTCETCHNTDDWDDTTWDHDDFFPIYSGSHRNAWNSCEDCHIASGNFQVFSCITCHEHEQSEMDDEHDDVPGYVYESQACFNCHPDGEE